MNKTLSERLTESVTLVKKLRNIGLNTQLDGMKELSLHLNEYVKNEKLWSGKIFIVEANLYIHVILTNKSTKNCSVRISKFPD